MSNHLTWIWKGNFTWSTVNQTLIERTYLIVWWCQIHFSVGYWIPPHLIYDTLFRSYISTYLSIRRSVWLWSEGVGIPSARIYMSQGKRQIANVAVKPISGWQTFFLLSIFVYNSISGVKELRYKFWFGMYNNHQLKLNSRPTFQSTMARGSSKKDEKMFDIRSKKLIFTLHSSVEEGVKSLHALYAIAILCNDTFTKTSWGWI